MHKDHSLSSSIASSQSASNTRISDIRVSTTITEDSLGELEESGPRNIIVNHSRNTANETEPTSRDQHEHDLLKKIVLLALDVISLAHEEKRRIETRNRAFAEDYCKEVNGAITFYDSLAYMVSISVMPRKFINSTSSTRLPTLIFTTS